MPAEIVLTLDDPRWIYGLRTGFLANVSDWREPETAWTDYQDRWHGMYQNCLDDLKKDYPMIRHLEQCNVLYGVVPQILSRSPIDEIQKINLLRFYVLLDQIGITVSRLVD